MFVLTYRLDLVDSDCAGSLRSEGCDERQPREICKLQGSRAADSLRVVAKQGTSELSPGETSFRKGAQVYKRHQTWELLSMPSGDMQPKTTVTY